MKVYQVSREYYPYANAGGLKEVVTGIAESLVKLGHSSSVFIPCYGFINRDQLTREESFFLNVKDEDINIKIYKTECNGVHVYFIGFKEVYEKNSVYTYTKKDAEIDRSLSYGHGFKDNDRINIVFQLAFLYYVQNYLEFPDVINLHDGHTGLIPGIIASQDLYRETFNRCKIFFTIHNAGDIYHQKISAEYLKSYNIVNFDYLCQFCFNAKIDPLFLSSYYARPITVSPYYADEILNLEHDKISGNYGKFCNDNNIPIVGITNGVNLEHFTKFGILGLPTRDLKNRNKESVAKDIESCNDLVTWGDLNFDKSTPIFLFQNRITEQKGIDKLITSLKSLDLKKLNANIVIMGEGESKYEKLLVKFARKYRSNIVYIQGYNENIAKKLFISSDFFILTSLWEPCGLTDFEAQLVGSVPIVHYTGGLKKVIDNKSGFTYTDFTNLDKTILKAINLYYEDYSRIEEIKTFAYKNIIENYLWDHVVEQRYLPLFKEI